MTTKQALEIHLQSKEKQLLKGSFYVQTLLRETQKHHNKMILQQQVSSFFLYIEEKLSQLDKRHRRVAEKRIFKFLFEIKMSADLPPDGEVNR